MLLRVREVRLDFSSPLGLCCGCLLSEVEEDIPAVPLSWGKIDKLLLGWSVMEGRGGAVGFVFPRTFVLKVAKMEDRRAEEYMLLL
jgi:hypothetical protein